MVLFLISCVADAPFNMEDPGESHGRLDLEAQKRLGNPNKTYKELQEEIEQNRLRIEELESQINLDQLGIDNKKDSPVGETKTEDKESKNKSVRVEKKGSKSQNKESKNKKNKKSKSPNKNTKPKNKVSSLNASDFRMPASSEEEEKPFFSELTSRLRALGSALQDRISGKTPLVLAIEDGDVERVKYLLFEDKVDPNAENREGQTALMYAVAKKRPSLEIIRFLLEAGADPLLKDNHNNSVSSFIDEGDQGSEEVRQLLDTAIIAAEDKITRLNSLSNREKCRRLFDYIYEKRNDRVQNLLETDIEINSCYIGRAQVPVIFYLAQKNPDPDLMRMLLEAGADPNGAPSSHGQTALVYLLARYEYNERTMELIRILLDAGADPLAKDNEGRRVLNFLHERRSGANQVRRLLDAARGETTRGETTRGETTRGETTRGETTRRETTRGEVAGLNSLSSREKCRRLFEYIDEKRNDLVKDLLETDIEINSCYSTRNDPVMPYVTWVNPDPDLMRMLLEAGADPNGKAPQSHTALMGLLYENRYNERIVELVKMLLEAGADPNQTSESNEYTLLMVLLSEHSRYDETGIELMRILLEAGADRTAKDKNGYGLLNYLREGRSGANQVRRLLDTARRETTRGETTRGGVAGLNSLSSREKCRRLFEYIDEKRNDLVKDLLETDIEINSCYSRGRRPVMSRMIWANPDPDLMRMLLEAGADPNGKSPQGQTALTVLLYTYDYDERTMELIRILLEAGADPLAKDNKNNPVSYFIDERDPESEKVRRLLNTAMGDMTRLNSLSSREKCRRLFDYIDEKRNDLVQNLLETDIEINSCYIGRAQIPVIFYLAQKNADPDLMRMLLEAGADPNGAPSSHGQTALVYLLARYEYNERTMELIRILLDAGADPLAKDNEGRRVLNFLRTRRSGANQVRQLLSVSRRKEQIENWLALSFSEREALRIEGKGITKELAGLNFIFPERDIQAEIQAIEAQDKNRRERIAKRKLNSIERLGSRERLRQDSMKKEIESVIYISGLSEELQNRIELINKRDEEFLNQRARSELDKRLAMTYEERSSQKESLSSLFDLSRLSLDLQREIKALEVSDAEIAENRKKASLWAAQKAREQRLRSALETIRDPTVVSYRQSRVKLWPIRCRNSNNPVYPYTRDDRPMSIELKGRGLRLEIRSQQSDEFTLLAEGVRRLDLQIEAPRDLYDSENYLSYKTLGERQEETFRLNNLIDIAETKSVSYLRISSSDSEDAVQVSWRGVKNRFFKGGFRIEITDRRSSDRSEWSVINELPVEWYIQSVTSSEMPSSYTLDALKAQAVAARSYFLNKALADRNVQARGWDIDPTQCNQVYKGSGDRSFSSRRGEQINIAVAETTGLVLTHNGKLAQTQYYACGTGQTKKGSNFIERSRNIPRNITCSRYPKNIINHHGYGMPQFAANYLTKNGWPRSNDNSPTEGAKVPDNIREPWDWMDVLNYFYRGESSRVKVQDFRQL